MRFKLPVLSGVPKETAQVLLGWQDALEREINRLLLEREGESMIKLKTYGSDQGNSNGTTEVEIVPRPAAGIIRKITSLRVFNADTVSSTINLAKKAGGTNYVFEDEAITSGDDWNLPVGEFLLLDGRDESLVLWLDGAVTTNELDWQTVWEDYVE